MPKSENRELIDMCFRRLLDKKEGLGLELGAKAIKIIVDELGGLTIYVPSLHTLELEARDNAICVDYGNGYSYTSISEVRGLTTRQVRLIIKKKGG